MRDKGLIHDDLLFVIELESIPAHCDVSGYSLLFSANFMTLWMGACETPFLLVYIPRIRVYDNVYVSLRPAVLVVRDRCAAHVFMHVCVHHTCDPPFLKSVISAPLMSVTAAKLAATSSSEGQCYTLELVGVRVRLRVRIS